MESSLDSRDFQIIIDGRYTLFHKHLSFDQFLFEVIRSFFSIEDLKYDQKIAQNLLEILKSSKKEDILEYLNDEVLQNITFLNLMKIKDKKLITESLLADCFTKTVIKIKILDGFFQENTSYPIIILIPFSHPLKEQYYRSLLSYNGLDEILKSIKFIRKNNLNDLITKQKPIFVSHKLKTFDNFINSNKKCLQIYFHNKFYNQITKENIEKTPRKIDFEIDLLNSIPFAIEFIHDKNLKINTEKVIRIGYFLMVKKTEDMFSKKMIRSIFPLEFIPIDIRYPIENKNYDMVIHKITDLIKFYGIGDTMDLCNKNFHDFYNRYKEKIIFIDKLEGIPVVNSRVLFQDFFANLFSNADFLKKIEVLNIGCKVKVPKIISVEKGEKYEIILEKMKIHNLNFPVIIKTKAALGEAKTHYMAVSLNHEGLKIVEQNYLFHNEDHIVQEFINHEETIFKIYVIGEQSHYYTRQSLPNVNNDILGGNHFFFDSQISFKAQLEYLKKRNGDFKEKNVKIDERLFDIMTETISQNIGFSLYGYDLIRDCENGDVHIVDINYFPGFKFEGDLQKLFLDFFLRKLQKNK